MYQFPFFTEWLTIWTWSSMIHGLEWVQVLPQLPFHQVGEKVKETAGSFNVDVFLLLSVSASALYCRATGKNAPAWGGRTVRVGAPCGAGRKRGRLWLSRNQKAAVLQVFDWQQPSYTGRRRGYRIVLNDQSADGKIYSRLLHWTKVGRLMTILKNGHVPQWHSGFIQFSYVNPFDIKSLRLIP